MADLGGAQLGTSEEAELLQMFLNHPPELSRAAQVCSSPGNGRSVRGVSGNTQGFSQAQLRTDSLSLPPHSIDQSKGQDKAPHQRVGKDISLSREELQVTHQRA